MTEELDPPPYSKGTKISNTGHDTQLDQTILPNSPDGLAGQADALRQLLMTLEFKPDQVNYLMGLPSKPTIHLFFMERREIREQLLLSNQLQACIPFQFGVMFLHK